MARAIADGAVRLEGFDDLRKQLKELGERDFLKAVAAGNKEAAQIVVDAAVAKAEAMGGVFAKVAPSIRAAAQQRAAVVKIGSVQYPMALGAEFGAKQYPQFPPWRGNQWQPDKANGVGYLVHPAVREHVEDIRDALDQRIGEITRRAFPD